MILPNFRGEWNIPVSFDQKWLGSQVDTIFSDDDQERLQAKLTVGESRLLGSDSHSVFIEETRSPDDLFMPEFRMSRQSCEMTYSEGVHHLVGIFNSLEDETKALLVFSNAENVTLDSLPKDKRVIDVSKSITVSCELIELPSKSWLDWCREKTPDQLRTNTAPWTTALLEDQKATNLKALSKKSRGVKRMTSIRTGNSPPRPFHINPPILRKGSRLPIHWSRPIYRMP